MYACVCILYSMFVYTNMLCMCAYTHRHTHTHTCIHVPWIRVTQKLEVHTEERVCVYVCAHFLKISVFSVTQYLKCQYMRSKCASAPVCCGFRQILWLRWAAAQDIEAMDGFISIWCRHWDPVLLSTIHWQSFSERLLIFMPSKTPIGDVLDVRSWGAAEALEARCADRQTDRQTDYADRPTNNLNRKGRAF